MLAITAFYEWLLTQLLAELDVDRCCATWPTPKQWAARAREALGQTALADVAEKEILAKACTPARLREQLLLLRRVWSEVKERLRAQLIPLATLRRMLETAGAPVEPEDIGISRERLQRSFWQAFFIRRRFTVLDLAVMTGLLPDSLDRLFGADGPWGSA